MLKRMGVGAALVLAACSDGGNFVPPADPGPGSAKVRFVVLGDTGAPAPDGDSETVAALLEKVCQLRGCDFAMVAGDNIYEMGATSEADPLFQLAFEQPFANLAFPFFMALGNHDNSHTLTGEGGANFKGDAEVAYHHSPLNTGGKWQMPDRHYSATWPADAAAPLLDLFVLDSSPVTHFYDDPDPRWSGEALQTYIAGQQTFLQDGLAASRARWKFALAHHPYISNGDHGDAGAFDVGAAQDPCTIAGPLASSTCRGEAYKAFVEQTICDKVDVFFNGHDHNLYWLEPVAACGRTHHILSGAGSKQRVTLDPERHAAYYQADQIFGFFWIELDGDTLKASVYTVGSDGVPGAVDPDGNPLPVFEKTIQRPTAGTP